MPTKIICSDPHKSWLDLRASRDWNHSIIKKRAKVFKDILFPHLDGADEIVLRKHLRGLAVAERDDKLVLIDVTFLSEEEKLRFHFDHFFMIVSQNQLAEYLQATQGFSYNHRPDETGLTVFGSVSDILSVFEDYSISNVRFLGQLQEDYLRMLNTTPVVLEVPKEAGL